jgi:hypothetical protein
MEKSTFKYKGKESDLLTFDLVFTRSVDSKGRPSGEVSGGLITVLVESTSNTSYADAAVSLTADGTGSIEIMNPKDKSSLKECKFEGAFITEYVEEGSSTGDSPMTMKISISAKKITYGDASKENEWSIT